MYWKIYSPILWVIFLFCWCFPLLWKTLVLCSPICWFFSFVSLAWGHYSNKILLQAMSEILLPMFSSTVFMVSGLTFKSLLFVCVCVCVCKKVVWFLFFFLIFSFWGGRVSVQLSQHHLLNKLSLAHCMCLLPLSNINWL